MVVDVNVMWCDLVELLILKTTDSMGGPKPAVAVLTRDLGFLPYPCT